MKAIWRCNVPEEYCNGKTYVRSGMSWEWCPHVGRHPLKLRDGKIDGRTWICPSCNRTFTSKEVNPYRKDKIYE